MNPLFIILGLVIGYALVLFIALRLMVKAGDAFFNRPRNHRLEESEVDAENCEVCGAPVADFYVSCAKCMDGLCRDCAEPLGADCRAYLCPTCAMEQARSREHGAGSLKHEGGAS